MSTKYYSDPSGAYIGAFVDGALPPAGAIEQDCPPKSAAALWLDGGWNEPDPRDAQRAVASLSRQAFCLALFREGILSEADAIAAAKGEWPAALNGVLAALPSDAAAEARIVWATSSQVRRMHPLLAQIAGNMAIDDLRLDDIFGLTGQGAGA